MTDMNEEFSRGLGSVKIHKPPLVRAMQCATHGEVAEKCFIGTMWTGCPQCRAEGQERDKQAEEDRAKAAALDHWHKTVEGAGIPERFRDRRFNTYVVTTPEQQAALDVVRQYTADWETVAKTGRCLILSGLRGTGKTHLACAAGMTVMHKHRASVMFETVQRAVRRVRDTWVKGSGKSESQAIAELVTPALLILDEVGVQSGTEFEHNILFDLLNERYLKRKPTIMLTNLPEQDIGQYIGERVMDRLREDGGTIVPFTWESHRKQMGR